MVPYLTPSFTVVVPDMRGIGDSSHPATGYDMASVADDFAELMTSLGHDTFHCCGEDWGGAALYQLAVRHPTRVRSLIFQEMLLPGFGLEDWAQFCPEQPRPHLWQVGLYAVPDVPELLIPGREREYFGRFLKNEAVDPASIDDDAVDECVRCYSQPGAIRSMCGFFRERASVQQNHDAVARGPKLTLPVLAIGAESFIGMEVKRQMERVAENVTYAEFEYGHQLAEECPELLGRRYLEFLSQVK